MDPLEREPCPFRIVDDVGGAFMMGARRGMRGGAALNLQGHCAGFAGGFIWHSVVGYRCAPAAPLPLLLPLRVRQ